MRAAVVLGVLVALALALATPQASSAAACEDSSCGVPTCSQPSVRLRPDMTRAVTVPCWEATGARLVTPPAHSQVSNVSADWYGLHFDARPDDDSPQYDEAVFELDGHEGSIEQRVDIEVVPTSQNSPPECLGDRVSQRSDGTGPVDVFMHPSCWDPDGDDFVIRGGPPGVHSESPKRVPAGSGDSNWHYRTATFSGDETTTIWATDVLGARSSDARLEVTVGPAVDRPPECRPSYWSSADTVLPIWSRPGATRRFGIGCEDLDGDPFTARLTSPPERGQMPLWEDHYGWIDALYAPADDSLEADPFSVTASGPRGGGPTAHMAIVPRALPENGGGGCAYGPADVVTDAPGAVMLDCSDDDGDPLSVEILSAPRHGSAAPAVVTTGFFGVSNITIPYVPDPGYEGYDCVRLKVTDGHGLAFDIAIDIWVRPRPPLVEAPPYLPPLPPLPLPDASAEPVRAQVERALGTTAVRRLHKTRGAEVWARRKLSRRDLRRWGRAPGLVVVCSARCKIRSDSRLATGLRSVRASRGKAVTAASAGQVQVLSLAIGRTERRALSRARKPRAKFSVSVRAGAGRAAAVKRSIPVR
jgi:hypothetical protein